MLDDREPDQASDEALLAAFSRGDGTAARYLIARLAPRLLAFASRMLNDPVEAEDVVQETMLRLWRIAPEWQTGRARVSTWTLTVAGNIARDRLRRRRRLSPLDAAGEPASDAPDPVERLVRSERVAALNAGLATLPVRQRQAIVLRHIEGLSNPEIAQIMDISVEAVESLTARGKRALALRLIPKKEALGP